MRIDKKNPRHIFLVLKIFVYQLIGILLRKINTEPERIILYGHNIDGNLKVLFEKLLDQKFEVNFILLNKNTYDKFCSIYPKDSILRAYKLKEMIGACGASIFITSHGPGVFSLLYKNTKTKFIDVWHGIPFKGYDKDDFKKMHQYSEIWLTSEKLKNIYSRKFGFKESKLYLTGYAKTDLFYNNSLNRNEIIEKYNLPKTTSYILIAPTWVQDAEKMGMDIFTGSTKNFLFELDDKLNNYNVTVLYRSHQNDLTKSSSKGLKNIIAIPYTEYPDTQDFLWISDAIVTDWSSIGFEFMPLNKPIIFIDIDPPFKKGFTFGPEYRYGKIVNDKKELIESLITICKGEDLIYKPIMKRKTVLNVVYGDTLDGRSTERYVIRLQELLGKKHE